MELKDLKQEYRLIDIFCELVSIPSPSLSEAKVAKKIIKILKDNKINAFQDKFGNVIAKIEATDKSKNPIILSAHMDVVGDESPVNICLSNGFIETDKKRTLGADDKAGVAAAILLACEIIKDKSLKHGGLELVFTKDEEQNMSGVQNLDMKQIESEHILVLDSSRLGDVLISGASYTKLLLSVESFKSGHSALDINDNTRLNAVKLISELVNKIPQGVYSKNELGVITSINIGAIIGGGVDSPFKKMITDSFKGPNYSEYILENSVTNVINTKAGASYSIRSSDLNLEKQLIADIQNIVEEFNKKYEGLAKAKAIDKKHLLPFEKSEDKKLVETAKIAAKNCGIPPKVSSFHAGAETHIYANNTNKFGKKFKPCLLGLADIYNMHSSDEKIDYNSYLKGYEFLKEFFITYNN